MIEKQEARAWWGRGCSERSRPRNHSAIYHERCLTELRAFLDKGLAGCIDARDRGVRIHPSDRRTLKLLLTTCKQTRERAERELSSIKAGELTDSAAAASGEPAL